jgi:hypothetical protein
MPAASSMRVLDERIVHAPIDSIFALARNVTEWPQHLGHYRFVRFTEHRSDGGGVVEMSANRPFGPLDWPTWWRSTMQVRDSAPAIRFRHIGGITTGMDVEWSFESVSNGTNVHVLHVWNGPRWPLIGTLAASGVIGPVFVHGRASRTLAGLARVAESR